MGTVKRSPARLRLLNPHLVIPNYHKHSSHSKRLSPHFKPCLVVSMSFYSDSELNFLDASRYGHPYLQLSNPSEQSSYPAMPQAQLDPYMARTPVGGFPLDPSFDAMSRAPLPATTYHSSFPTPASSSPVTPQHPPDGSVPSPSSKPSPTSASAPALDARLSPLADKKKKYPCPHSQRFNCPDRFTTSGHAARHGKKHTGEKNVTCPTCGKAFTRKDNMKQHERTHSNKPAREGENPRNNSNSASVTSAPSLHRQSTTSSSQTSSTRTPSSTESALRPTKSTSTASLTSRSSTRSQQLLPQPPHLDQPPNERGDLSKRRQSSSVMQDVRETSEVDGEGDSPGLDALAHVASELSH